MQMEEINQKIKLLIADDHQLFNDGMKMLLSLEDHLEVAGQVFNGRDIINSVARLQPDIILLDINLPIINGMDVAADLILNFPRLKIIMLSMYNDRKFVEDCQKLGVHGYILKNSGVEEVLTAIEKVMAGQKYYEAKLILSPTLHAQDIFVKQFQLTKREIEIITLIGKSHTNEEIADKLFLSVATVKTHRNNINIKLNIKKPADLVKFAVEYGLV
jgi:DNA-binding NarL/FixJ family response regulator